MIIAWYPTLNVVMSFNIDVVHCMVINPAKFHRTLPYINFKQDCTVLQLSIDNSMIQKISGNSIHCQTHYIQPIFPTNKRCGNVENWPLSGVYTIAGINTLCTIKDTAPKIRIKCRSIWHSVMHSHCSLSFFTMWTSSGHRKIQQ